MTVPSTEPKADPRLQPIRVLRDDAPQAEAVRFGDDWLSWEELERRSRQFAQGLRSLGLDAGDRWAVLARNRLEWAEMTIGSGRAGTKYVPLNWHLTVPELAHLLVDSGARVLIVDPQLADAGRAAAQGTSVERIITLDGDYEQWLTAQSDDPLADVDVGLPLQYTGGTTGRSKGVIHSFPARPASELADAYGRWGELTGMPARSNMAIYTPIYHAFGGALLRTALARGNRVDIVDHWDPVEMLAMIEHRQIAGCGLVPTQFIRLLKLDPDVRTRYDVSSIRWILHTAAPCPVWAKRDMIGWFGPVITELYGSSEGVGPVIATSQEWLERPGTVGRATAALELFVIDDNGNDLPPGEVGVIYARLLAGAPRYFDDPDKTAASTLPDGRFTVGDIGWLDEDGFLFLADRRADLIIVGGSNVYPAEVEAVLSEHPAVGDVAVFGIPDHEWGQKIKAVVEPVAGTPISEAELLEFARQRLAKYKLPASIDIVDQLPREASGKLKKHKLRDPYWVAADDTGASK